MAMQRESTATAVNPGFFDSVRRQAEILRDRADNGKPPDPAVFLRRLDAAELKHGAAVRLCRGTAKKHVLPRAMWM